MMTRAAKADQAGHMRPTLSVFEIPGLDQRNIANYALKLTLSILLIMY